MELNGWVVPQLVAVHFDHRWHAESTNTAEWLSREMADDGIPLIVRRRQATPPQSTLSQSTTSAERFGSPEPAAGCGPQSEAAARAWRYESLAELARQTPAEWVLTGHTRDDQVETILLRIARGTGLPGLTGIPPRRPLGPNCHLLRPLLTFSRTRLRDFLHRLGRQFCDDPTNVDLQWTRNRVRGQVLPWLRQHLTPRLDDSLLGLAAVARDFQAVVGSLAASYQEAVVDEAGVAMAIALQPLAGLPEPTVRTLLRYWWNQAQLPEQEMNQAHWRKLTELAVRPSLPGSGPTPWPCQVHLPGHIVAKRSRGRLRIQRLGK
jgi:tRNA(Ile)-lysidine synthase